MKASFEQIKPLVELAMHTAGDFAEFGVYRGETFIPLAEAARTVAKACHAVDSFNGMAEPSDFDYEPDGTCKYPLGSMNTGGSQALRQATSHLSRTVKIWEGQIPVILYRMPLNVRFAFAHVDLDHYVPTLLTLRWVWPRMNVGGIMACHDWLPERDCLATKGIREWMQESEIEPAPNDALISDRAWLEADVEERLRMARTLGRHIWFTKG